MNTYSDVLISDLSDNGFRGVPDTTDQYNVAIINVHTEHECDRLEGILKTLHYVRSFSVTRMYSTHSIATEYAIGVHVHSLLDDDSLRSMARHVQSLLIDGVCIRVELCDIDVQQYGQGYRIRVVMYDLEMLCICYAYLQSKGYSYILVNQECGDYTISFELDDLPNNGEEHESYA